MKWKPGDRCQVGNKHGIVLSVRREMQPRGQFHGRGDKMTNEKELVDIVRVRLDSGEEEDFLTLDVLPE